MDWGLVPQFLSLVFGVFSTVALMTWWLSGQFKAVREEFFSKMDSVFDKLVIKMEYHERHDDSRFSDVQSSLSELRIQNAYVQARLGRVFDQEETESPRRRSARSAAPSGSIS